MSSVSAAASALLADSGNHSKKNIATTFLGENDICHRLTKYLGCVNEKISNVQSREGMYKGGG